MYIRVPCLGHLFTILIFPAAFQNVPTTICWWYSTVHHSLLLWLRHLQLLSNLLSCLYALDSRNSLALDLEKSYAILLSSSKCNESLTNIASVDIAGLCVTLSDHFKLLGVTLDSNHNFSKHASSIYQVSNVHLRALLHLRHAFNDDTIKSIGQALVSSWFDYVMAYTKASHR